MSTDKEFKKKTAAICAQMIKLDKNIGPARVNMDTLVNKLNSDLDKATAAAKVSIKDPGQADRFKQMIDRPMLPNIDTPAKVQARVIDPYHQKVDKLISEFDVTPLFNDVYAKIALALKAHTAWKAKKNDADKTKAKEESFAAVVVSFGELRKNHYKKFRNLWDEIEDTYYEEMKGQVVTVFDKVLVNIHEFSNQVDSATDPSYNMYTEKVANYQDQTTKCVDQTEKMSDVIGGLEKELEVLEGMIVKLDA